MRIARGLLRLWLVTSVVWIGLISAVYWPIVSYEWKVFREKPIMFDDLPDAPWAINWNATHVAEAAFIPPVLVLVLGAAVAWVVKGFRAKLK
jgi:hypothetical protein